MAIKDELIAGIRTQNERLAKLAEQLETSSLELTTIDCRLYEMTSREVEKKLRILRRLASKELIQETSSEI